MEMGVPFACSSAASLPEVGGDAAIYFDPTDDSSMEAAITRLLREPDLRRQLTALGPQNARRFSWDKAAGETIEAYQEALNKSTTDPMH